MTFALYTGGPVEGLSAAAPLAEGFFITVDGSFVSYLPGAPDFVNATFNDHFGGEIPPSTPLIVFTPGIAPGFTFPAGYFSIGTSFVEPATLDTPPKVVVQIVNGSEEVIVAAEVTICPINAFGELIWNDGNFCFIGVYNIKPINPEGAGAPVWELLGPWETATSATVTPRRAVTESGAIWAP